MKKRRILVVVLLCIGSFNSFSQEPFIGEIRMFAGNFAPRGWAFCDGQLLPIVQNSALFSLIGTIYGGDGRTTFALPDLRGRGPVHAGFGPGLPQVRLGERSGTTSFTITTNNLPPHSHTGHIKIADSKGEQYYSNNGFIADSSRVEYQQYTASQSGIKTIQGVQTTNTGGGQPVNIRSPYLGINYIIALQGIFPSRN